MHVALLFRFRSICSSFRNIERCKVAVGECVCADEDERANGAAIQDDVENIEQRVLLRQIVSTVMSVSRYIFASTMTKKTTTDTDCNCRLFSPLPTFVDGFLIVFLIYICHRLFQRGRGH